MDTMTDTSDLKVFTPAPDLPPPLESRGVIGWLRENLFSSKLNTALSLLSILLLWKSIPPLADWLIIHAQWTGGHGQPCPPEHAGACWPFIKEKFRVLMMGIYPGELLWRPTVSAGILGLLSVLTILRILSTRKLILFWYILPMAAFWLIGGGWGLKSIDQSLWGGLMLSLGLAVVGILFSLPLGILLALGRRWGGATIKALSTCFIECIRGIPLITILFMASVMLPIFLPKGIDINNLLRVQIGIIFFSSAYMAEVVRGGLQSVHPGQMEAAKALGLSSFHTTWYIVLPQALKNVIPSLIGRCVALFKDTSLVIIVGLLDFLGMIKASAQDPKWLGHDAEAYVFCALVYWVICFTISRYGKSIEDRNSWS